MVKWIYRYDIEVLFYLKEESIVLCLQLENDATSFCSKYSFMSGNTFDALYSSLFKVLANFKALDRSLEYSLPSLC